MDHLLREKAPISDAGWAEIDSEAARTLRHYLSGRKVVDYRCDGDWHKATVTIGRVSNVKSGNDSVDLNRRVAQPLSEVRVRFQISRAELERLDRGAKDFNTDPIVDAAREAAALEDSAIFAGNDDLGIAGIASASPHAEISIQADFLNFPDSVAKAIDLLQEVGIAGPFALALGSPAWTSVMESSESGGYPLLKHLRLMVDGPVVWAPALEGAVIISQRGGDFEIVGGQDWSIGYLHHDADNITLYLEESFTSLVNTPEAAVRFAIAK